MTRRTILTFGLLLVLAGLFIFDQGLHVLVPIAELTGLVSHIQNENSIIAPFLISVPPSNHSYISANLSSSDRVQGMLQVSDGREIAFYIMNEGNFSQWRSGHPSAVILARPIAISYNFTLTPKAAGTYYFIFDNQDTSRRVVIFSLNLIEDKISLSPIIEYAEYELLGLGIFLSALGVKLGGKKIEKSSVTEAQAAIGWSCKFCGAENLGEQAFCSKCHRSQK